MQELNLIHRVRLPGADTGAPCPVIVMVHGWLGNENVMWVFEKTLPPLVVVVSPRGPFEADGGYGWSAGQSDAATFEQGLSALRDFVVRLPDVYLVDAGRLLLMGFSQGAAVSYALALKHPELVSGVVALAGFLPEQARLWLAPGRLAGKHIFIAHGVKDETAPVGDARQAREALEFAGADVSYHEYLVGHKLSALGMRDLKHWLASRVKPA